MWLDNIQYLARPPWTYYSSESGINKAYEYSFDAWGGHCNATDRLSRVLVRSGANRKTDHPEYSGQLRSVPSTRGKSALAGYDV